jgi:hypothetical protein
VPLLPSFAWPHILTFAQSSAEREGERSGELEAAVERQDQPLAGKPDQQNALHELLDYLAQV